MLNASQIRLVQNSWQLIAAIQPRVAAAFYTKLFLLDPSIARLFKSDMTEQGLGSHFTPDVRDAWTRTYELPSSTMRRAAAQ